MRVAVQNRKNRKKKKEGEEYIDIAMTILEKLPKHDDELYPLDYSTSFGGDIYPLKYFKDLIEKIGGEESISDVVSKIITTVLPPLEIAIKGVLLTNIQQLVQDCSLNLWIPKQLIRDGIVVDMKYLDVFDMFNTSPLSERGQFLYHDCEDCEILEDLKASKDFNALMYYIKQRNSNRVVWKDERDNVILTLDYSERPQGLKDCEGKKRESNNAQSIPNVPYNNCLQLFIGDASCHTNQFGQLIFNDLEDNRYWNKESGHGRTVMSFNTDYIMSLKLFDAKCIASQLVSELMGVKVGVDVSFKAQLLNEEIENIISQVIRNDNYGVSDCFFAFSNKDYDALMQKAEIRHSQGMPFSNIEGNFDETVELNILKELENVSKDATQEEIKTFLKGAMYNIRAHKRKDGKFSFSADGGVNTDMMLETLLDSLCKIVIRSVISPKVYLLILTNRALMGDVRNTDLEDFIERCKNLFMNITTQITDLIMQAIMDIIVDQLKPLAAKLVQKIGMEQVEYYRELLNKMIECVRFKRRNEDFDIANVQYADIYNTEEQITDVEC